ERGCPGSESRAPSGCSWRGSSQRRPEVFQSAGQAVLQGCLRLPSEDLAGPGGVRPALFRVILGQGLEYDLARAVCEPLYEPRQVEHGDLVLGAEVERHRVRAV